jgi:hypothetical protein
MNKEKINEILLKYGIEVENLPEALEEILRLNSQELTKSIPDKTMANIMNQMKKSGIR